MAIAYYITSHGLGHAVRSACVIDRIPPDVPVTVCTAVPDRYLRQMIERPIRVREVSFDCGTLQGPDHAVDADATLRCYGEIHQSNQTRLDAEARFLSGEGIRVVVSDVASFPMSAARQADVPAAVVANFTWADIYEPYVRALPAHAPLLDALRAEYRVATHCFRLPMSLSMSDGPRPRDVGLVCREGRPIREALSDEYHLDPGDRWIFIYLGIWPNAFDWRRLAKAPRTRFLCLAGVPEGAPVTRIDADRFPVQHVVASCDVVLGKPGYGIASDCMASERPFVYSRREDFAEFDALHRDLQEWGLGLCLEPSQFHGGDLVEAIDRAIGLQIRQPAKLTGAAEVAERLVALHADRKSGV